MAGTPEKAESGHSRQAGPGVCTAQRRAGDTRTTDRHTEVRELQYIPFDLVMFLIMDGFMWLRFKFEV